MKKQILSIILAICMVFSVMPMAAFAESSPALTALDGTSGKDSSEGFAKLFDGNTSTKWCVQYFDTKGGAFVIFKANESVRVVGYTLTTGNDNASYKGRNPKSWVLYGCNDYSESNKSGGTWKVIHTVTSDTVLKDENKKAFDFSCDDNTALYKYYKLEIKSTAGATLMQLSELSLKTAAAGGESVNADDVYSVIYTDDGCEHEWKTNGITGDATCISHSYKEVVCTKCGATGRVGTGTAKLGHTHTGAGTQCTRCGRKNLIKIGDSYGDYFWLSSDKALKKDVDYESSGASIYIYTSEKIEISNYNADVSFGGSVSVSTEGGQSDIVLSGLNLVKSINGFRISHPYADNKITLKPGSRNIIRVNASSAGISFGVDRDEEQKLGSLVISGEGELFCVGGSSPSNKVVAGAGIGASSFHDVTGNITITGGCKVTAIGGKGAAGIGSGSMVHDGNTFCKNILINNATVTAIGNNIYYVGINYGSAGIGAGPCSCVENIKINNSTVVAKGSICGAGIGGGYQCDHVSGIYIENSTVYAKGGEDGAGIGGGVGNFSIDTIDIYKSEVTAIGTDAGAGIGAGGYIGNNLPQIKNITVSKSILTAIGGCSSASNTAGSGIGGAYCKNGGQTISDIKIENSVVTAQGFLQHSAIGGYANDSVSNITIEGGSVKLLTAGVNLIGTNNAAVTPKNSNGEDVALLTVANPEGRDILVNGVWWEPIDHTALDPEDTNLYAYVPKSTTSARFSSGKDFHMHYLENENRFVSEPWEEAWDANNLYHWHNCEYKDSLGCTVTTEKVSHTYDSNGVCSVCGYGKKYTVTFSVLDFSTGNYKVVTSKTLDNLSSHVLEGVTTPSSSYESEKVFDHWIVDGRSSVTVDYDTLLGNIANLGTTTGSNGERTLKIKAVYRRPLLKISSSEQLKEGTDYIYTDEGITILTDKPVTISNRHSSVVSTDTITVASGVNANITLDNVNIDVSDMKLTAAFKIARDSTGNVTVTLSGENTLKSGEEYAGLQKDGNYGTLTIEGTGSLTAVGGYNAAGIGGAFNADAANITIEGGNITAIGGYGAAGIGGGFSGSGKNITIKGFTGTVPSYMTIPTVTVTAKGDEWGAGIGGGFAEITVTKGLVTIEGTDETVETEPVITASSEAAGIGGCDPGTGLLIGTKITIEAGTITANNIAADKVTVTGGSIKSEVNNPIDKDGNKLYKMVIPNSSSGTVLIDGKEYTPKNHTALDPDDYNLYVYLTGESHTVSVNGTIINYEFKDGEFKRVTDLTVASSQTLSEGTDYTYSDGVLTVMSEKPVVISMRSGVTKTGDVIKVADGVSANITLSSVNIDSSGTGSQNVVGEPAFEIASDSDGNVTLTLKENTENTLKSGTYCAGLQKNGENGTVTITGKGKLNAYGGLGGAGIGSGIGKTSGIIIKDGTIYAEGNMGAGIGGGYGIFNENTDKFYGDGENITISGGNVTAIGGGFSAGIGGGMIYGSARNITISGGTVNVTAGSYSSAIGNAAGPSDATSEVKNITISGGTVIAKVTTASSTAIGGSNTKGTVDNIVISGGTVTAEGGYVGIGNYLKTSTLGTVEITGGSVKATAKNKTYGVAIGKYDTPITPTNGDGESVYLLTLSNAKNEKVYIDGKEYTPKNHTAADSTDTNLYVYLTGEKHTVKVGSVTTVYHFDSENNTFTATNCYDKNNDHLCDLCGEKISEHTGGTADCLHKAKCSVCGEEYGSINASVHAGTKKWTTQTATQHEAKWSCCEKTAVALENHEWKNGTCSECGYKCTHTYEWQSENGKYWKKCKTCGYETAKKNIPEIKINGADKVCTAHDYTFTVTLFEGAKNPVYGYDNGFMGNAPINFTVSDGVYSAKIGSGITNDVDSFTVTAYAETADGYTVSVTKTVEVQKKHIDKNVDHICDLCGDYFILYGDVNGDGEVTPSDVVLLRRYFANYDSETNTSTITVAIGADVNGDGALTPSDVVLLRRYFANYDSDTDTSSIVLGK